jgi:iron uptake system component EfeO
MAILTAAIAVLSLAGCVQNPADAGGTTVTVSSTADECTLSASTAPSGNVVFSVTNNGDAVTEFYLLAEDGKRVVGEVENIGPGISRDLTVNAKAGTYFTVCKPGMAGDGVGKAEFTVTDQG